VNSSIDSPLVSLLMPAYNCEKFIKQAIDGVLNQTYENFELLIADDGSKDETKAIIDSYQDKRIKRFHNTQNLGYLKTSNKLVKEAKGEFISFQDADDYCELNRLEIMIDFLKKNHHISCVGSNICKVDEKGELISKSNFPLNHTEIVKSFDRHRIVMTGSSLMVKKEVIDALGLYNEYFDRIGSEDIYWFSLILDSYQVANLSEHLYYYRSNPSSVSLTHKNPKAFVGHELIMLMRLRRLHNKMDYILSKDFKKVDVFVKFLLMMKNVSVNKFLALLNFVGALFAHPLIAVSFVKPFYKKMLNA
jgi:glycosyltransferase involved in cell wall biosynthesis